MLQLFSGALATSTIADSIVKGYKKTLIKELLDYFSEKYFSVQLGTYENITVTPMLGVTLRNIILALAAAIIIAVCVTAYMRVNIGGFVRRLIAENCLSPADAKTLYQLGYFRSIGIRQSLSKSAALSMVVSRIDATDEPPSNETAEDAQNEENTPAEETVADEENTYADVAAPAEEKSEEPDITDPTERDFDAKKAIRIAIKREKINFLTAKFYIPAELRDRAEIRFDSKGSSWKSAILISAIAVVVAGVLCVLVPDLVQLADNVITWLAP